MSLPVFLGPVTGVVVGATVQVRGDEAHHAVVVRRTRAGEQVVLVDGTGTSAACVVTETSKSSLTATVPIIDVTGLTPVEHRAYVPPRAVVVPGTRPRDFPAGTYHLACALIIGWRSKSTDLKVSLNDALREHGLGA